MSIISPYRFGSIDLRLLRWSAVSSSVRGNSTENVINRCPNVSQLGDVGRPIPWYILVSYGAVISPGLVYIRCILPSICYNGNLKPVSPCTNVKLRFKNRSLPFLVYVGCCFSYIVTIKSPGVLPISSSLSLSNLYWWPDTTPGCMVTSITFFSFICLEPRQTAHMYWGSGRSPLP